MEADDAVDRNASTRSNPKEQDGTSGGGVGVAEMRERKMEGRGLPSPQVSRDFESSYVWGFWS